MKDCCTLPQNMAPSQKAFEDLGFNFKEPESENMYWATLPEKWAFKLPTQLGCIQILDANGICRAVYDYKNSKMQLA